MSLTIGKKEAVGLLRTMVRIRRLEETAAELYGKGIIRGFLHLYNGQEAIAAGIMANLSAEDRILSTYREHGHALARGMKPDVILSELAGKKEGCCGGRGGSMHLFDSSLNFFGGTAIVGGHLPLAVGMALADRKRQRASVTVCIFGEGAAAEGIFQESMNLAALWQVPVLFAMENNRYAMGTALSRSQKSADYETRGKLLGFPTQSIDGMDVESVYSTTSDVIGQIRAKKCPALVVYETYRFRAHSMFDAELYRSKEEVTEWKKKDPIDRWKSRLIAEGMLDEKSWQAMIREAATEMEAAAGSAQSGTAETIETMEDHLHG